MARDSLTKEAFAGLFYDIFQLTNYAIDIAQKQIASGNEDVNVTELLETIKIHPPEQLVEQEEETPIVNE